jgi:hypothetical protein
MTERTPRIIEDLNEDLEIETMAVTHISTVESIAKEAGITEETLYHWTRNDPQFKEELSNMFSEDGADLALLLIETKDRYTR